MSNDQDFLNLLNYSIVKQLLARVTLYNLTDSEREILDKAIVIIILNEKHLSGIKK